MYVKEREGGREGERGEGGRERERRRGRENGHVKRDITKGEGRCFRNERRDWNTSMELFLDTSKHCPRGHVA